MSKESFEQMIARVSAKRSSAPAAPRVPSPGPSATRGGPPPPPKLSPSPVTVPSTGLKR
jgi:hypothetical protein